MPELPEVEITRLRLTPHLVGRQISRVLTTAPSYFFVTSPSTLKRRLKGNCVAALNRYGKYLVATLADEFRLVLHLGMTGQLFTETATSPRLLTSTAASALGENAQCAFQPDEHTHLQVFFEDEGPAIYFRDVRKFGKVILLKPNEKEPRLDKLGPDALTLDGALLHHACRRRKTAIKTLLLDQKVTAGVGNIYADEALFLAGILPTRAALSLSKAQCDALAEATKQVLERSIETGGSSISDYIAPDGSDGAYQDERKVYARTGEPCLNCQSEILRIVVGQRGTHYCGHCQR